MCLSPVDGALRLSGTVERLLACETDVSRGAGDKPTPCHSATILADSAEEALVRLIIVRKVGVKFWELYKIDKSKIL